MNPDWRDKFPNHSSAYKSVSAFVVRKGDPKQIKDWGDLVRDDVKIALVNPKTGGNGRYVFLAAYGFALQKFGGDRDQANAFVKKLYENVPVLDTGGRAATTIFGQRGIADVLITFEAEAHMVKKEFPKEEFQVILPSVSVVERALATGSSFVVARGSMRKANDARSSRRRRRDDGPRAAIRDGGRTSGRAVRKAVSPSGTRSTPRSRLRPGSSLPVNSSDASVCRDYSAPSGRRA